MRNSLASPIIIGVSSGAGFAALIILILFPKYYCLVPLGAFVVTMLIYGLAWKDGLVPNRLILAGVAVNSLLGAVSVVGLLGFVGLIVPHISRLIIGSDYRFLFPAAILLGAIIVLICDLISRVLFAPIEIPVGIIMSALGAPFFLYLLRSKEAKQ